MINKSKCSALVISLMLLFSANTVLAKKVSHKVIAANTTQSTNNAAASQNTQATPAMQSNPVTFTSETGKFSYTVGVEVGRNLKTQALGIEPDLVAKGLKDSLQGNKLALTDAQMQQILQNVQAQLQAKRTLANNQQTGKNAKQEIDFLSNNAKKPGVHVLPSGLQYKVINAGTGVKPASDDTVIVNYVGSFISGKVFDSSYQRGEPASLPVSGVILGWQQALKMMPVGSTWELYVPANLAYGSQGFDNVIGPNQILIFKLQLLGIQAKAKQ